MSTRRVDENDDDGHLREDRYDKVGFFRTPGVRSPYSSKITNRLDRPTTCTCRESLWYLLLLIWTLVKHDLVHACNNVSSRRVLV